MTARAHTHVCHSIGPSPSYFTHHLHTLSLQSTQNQWVEWAGNHAEALPFVAISMGTGEDDFKKVGMYVCGCLAWCVSCVSCVGVCG